MVYGTGIAEIMLNQEMARRQMDAMYNVGRQQAYPAFNDACWQITLAPDGGNKPKTKDKLLLLCDI